MKKHQAIRVVLLLVLLIYCLSLPVLAVTCYEGEDGNPDITEPVTSPEDTVPDVNTESNPGGDPDEYEGPEIGGDPGEYENSEIGVNPDEYEDPEIGGDPDEYEDPEIGVDPDEHSLPDPYDEGYNNGVSDEHSRIYEESIVIPKASLDNEAPRLLLVKPGENGEWEVLREVGKEESMLLLNKAAAEEKWEYDDALQISTSGEKADDSSNRGSLFLKKDKEANTWSAKGPVYLQTWQLIVFAVAAVLVVFLLIICAANIILKR